MECKDGAVRQVGTFHWLDWWICLIVAPLAVPFLVWGCEGEGHLMEETQLQNQSKKNGLWWGVLGVIGAVIVALVVGIVVVNINKGDNVTVDAPGEGRYEWDDPGAAKEYFALVGHFENIDDEAEAMLNQTPADPEAVKDLYLSYANQYISDDELFYTVNVLLNGDSVLENGGYKEWALKLLMEFDLTKFDQYEQGVYERAKMYLIIIRLAEELGYSDIVAEYQEKMAAVQDVYDYYWSLESWNRPEENVEYDFHPSEEELNKEVYEEE